MARRISIVAGALAVAAIALGGCGGSTPSASGTSTTTLPGATSASSTSTSSTVPAAPACQTDELHVETIIATDAAGTDYLEVVLGAKAASTRCEVNGYPNASVYGVTNGVQATLPEVPVRDAVTGDRPLGLAPMPIVIGPQSGDTAAFYLGVLGVQSAGKSCQTADGIEFQVPGSTAWSGAVPFSAASIGPNAMGSTLTACGPSMSVSVFQPSSLPDVSG
jgi:hypothetical protein